MAESVHVAVDRLLAAAEAEASRLRTLADNFDAGHTPLAAAAIRRQAEHWQQLHDDARLKTA